MNASEVQLLELEVSFLGLPGPLLPAGLSGLRCLGLVVLDLLLVRQQQLLGVDPTLEVELVEGLAQFDNINNENWVKRWTISKNN